MFLAEKTVKNYVSSLLAKLGMERRTQAAIFASKHRHCLGRTLALPGGGDVGEHGLRNLRERAERRGGSLQVESAPGRGTTLTWSVPRTSAQEIR